MTFSVSSLTRCAGQNHYVIVTDKGTIQTTKEEVEFDPSADLAETRDKVIDRIRSAVKEANASTFAQAKTAIEGKTFKI